MKLLNSLAFKFNELKQSNEMVLPSLKPIKIAPASLTPKQLAVQRRVVKDYLMKNWTLNGYDLNRHSHLEDQPKYLSKFLLLKFKNC